MKILDDATLIRAEMDLRWPPAYVDEHFASGQLALAASCYAAQSVGRVKLVAQPHEFAGWTSIPEGWPLHSGHWVQFRSARYSLARAAAYLALEVERLDRADAARRKAS